MTHKILRYHVTCPGYDVEKLLKTYVLHYAPLDNPVQLIDGSISYGELETFEMVPDIALPYLVYVGMRDATDKEEREIEFKVERERELRNRYETLGGYRPE